MAPIYFLPPSLPSFHVYISPAHLLSPPSTISLLSLRAKLVFHPPPSLLLKSEIRIWQESRRMLREGRLKATTLPFFLLFSFSNRVSRIAFRSYLRCFLTESCERVRSTIYRERERVIFPWWKRDGDRSRIKLLQPFSRMVIFFSYRRNGWELSH